MLTAIKNGLYYEIALFLAFIQNGFRFNWDKPNINETQYFYGLSGQVKSFFYLKDSSAVKISFGNRTYGYFSIVIKNSKGKSVISKTYSSYFDYPNTCEKFFLQGGNYSIIIKPISETDYWGWKNKTHISNISNTFSYLDIKVCLNRK
ncbi:hypothetical protein SAMN05216249_11191 [Acetitomaculum ruminis DSM 5522]|uniref:Uncharacterized protein n=1 Tax=Acetitomaculum ruminis DSM 5522 TaxID=1120918 RepID=A0A1I0YWP6_9FIRM|nr:hypothetical protein [Acetitomaculum ruminis]SFB17256.1 hypothetical protein SAMN05216249_11191 [Acetitomaculum ruminis DSM 5522]